MRKARIAEWMLSQVLTRERAASAVGDWMEDMDERGSAWFWSCVLRTANSRVWSDLTESPHQMAGLAFRAYLRLWAYLVTYCLVLSVVLLIGMLVVGAIRDGSKLPALSFPDPAVNPLVSGLLAFVNFRAGQWIAQRAPGREVAASLALWLLQQAVAILLTIGAIVVFHLDRAAFTPADLLFKSPMSLVSDAALFAGALQVRRRALRN
ncbi:MAG: hypothetical protein ABSB15_26805 [Bryobacteraceae bacterium]|jgi:hypothetical protein